MKIIDGKKIRAAREAKGLSRAGLSRLSGISIRTLEDWESGMRTPRNIDIIDTLVQALGIQFSDLYTDEYLSELNAAALGNSDRIQNESSEEMALIEKIEQVYERENITGVLRLLDRFIYALGVPEALKIVEVFENESREN